MSERETRLSLGRACGKVILLGEHSVVYGHPALAVGIDQGAKAIAERRHPGPSRLTVGTWGLTVSDDNADTPLAKAFGALLRATRVMTGSESAYDVRAETELPPGGGLGCSAALGVAVARAIDPSATTPEVECRVTAWEEVFHGTPSGVDTAVSARGGCIFFQHGRRIDTVRTGAALSLCVGHTGAMSSTRAMVEAVSHRRARSPSVVRDAFEEIAELVVRARRAVEVGAFEALGELMSRNQRVLESLQISSPDVETLCDLAVGAGALGAKLTGAGGGGSVIALVGRSGLAENVLEAWRVRGYSGFVSRVTDETCKAVVPPEPEEVDAP